MRIFWPFINSFPFRPASDNPARWLNAVPRRFRRLALLRATFGAHINFNASGVSSVIDATTPCADRATTFANSKAQLFLPSRSAQ